MEILISVVTAVLTGFLGWRSWDHWSRARRIARTPTTPVGSLETGLVEVCGRVRSEASPPLLSPATSTPCVYYRYQVQDRQDGTGHWVTVEEEERFAACRVDDGTGSVRVDLRSAELDLSAATHRSRGMIRTTRRYFETVLGEGDEVYVLGRVVVRADAEPRIGRDGDLLLVSDRREEALIGHHRFYALLFATGILAIWALLAATLIH